MKMLSHLNPELLRSSVLGILLLGLVAVPARAQNADAGNIFFETKIRPVLVESCLECHGDKKQKGGLRLDSKEHLLKGGSSGAAVVPGKANDSLLIKAIRYTDPDLKMPRKAKLPEAVIADFAKWIDMGAPDPRDGKTPVVSGSIDWSTARQFWSFQPVKKPSLPTVKN